MLNDAPSLDRGSWPAPLGSTANDRTARVPLSGVGRERWRVSLPDREVNGITVAMDGTCFVAGHSAITALAGPETRWSVDTDASVGCLVLTSGLLVTWEAKNLVVRDQQAGAVVSTIEAPLLCTPALTSTGLVVFVSSHDGVPSLRASTVSGEPRWEHPLREWSPHPPLVRSDHLAIADGGTLRAFDVDGNPLWTVDRREFRSADVVTEPGEIVGPLVGLPNGNVLAAIRSGDTIGYLVVDPQQGSVHLLPAHLPPQALVLPLGSELVVMPGWPEEDSGGQFRPVVVGVDVTSGATVLHHKVPTAPHAMVAGSTGLIAIAGSPSWDRWDKYHGWPGYHLEDECYVYFLDRSGLRGEWRPERPVTGPLAVGVDGDLLVPVSGELYSVE